MSARKGGTMLAVEIPWATPILYGPEELLAYAGIDRTAIASAVLELVE